MGSCFDVLHSTADNLLNARRGYQLAIHAESAGRLLPGSYNYYALSWDARHYLPLGESIVIANRVQVGNIDQAGDDPGNVPFSKKFFLGGASSVRGWGRYEISPLSGRGCPLGGNSMFAFSSELRAVIRGNLGGVVFLDGGNVWTDRLDRQARRPALCRWSGHPLPDAGRAGALRHRLAAQPHSGAAHRWSGTNARLADALQHRPGVLTGG